MYWLISYQTALCRNEIHSTIGFRRWRYATFSAVTSVNMFTLIFTMCCLRSSSSFKDFFRCKWVITALMARNGRGFMVMHLSMSNLRGGGVGHRVGILTFSKKKYQNPHPWQKQMVYFSSTLSNWQIKCMMSGQNPHPGDMRHSQIPVGCPTPPPPHLSLGLDTVRCIMIQWDVHKWSCIL